jgi:8-oxo-dGTP diphosphatase
MRRFGERVEPSRRYVTRPGAYVVLLRGGDVLLTHQAEPVPEFQLPGGGIDAGEQPIAALYREVYEETGWSIALCRRLGAYRRFSYMPEYDLWAEKVCAVYLARPARRLGPPTEPHHTALWSPLADAARIVADRGAQHYLRQLRG